MDKICKANGISMRKEIDKNGTIYYYNDKGEYHGEEEPAVEYADGTKYWFKNGERHREDGPAVEWKNGFKSWYKNNKLHREDGPAIEYANGDKYYYYNGKLYSGIKTDEEWIRFVNLMVFQ